MPPQAHPPAAPRPQVVDLMPAFWRYIEQAQQESSNQRRRDLFRRRLSRPHADLFTASVIGEPAPGAKQWNARLDLYWDKVQPLLPRMRVVAPQVRALLDQVEPIFRRELPDFSLRQPVYLMPALFAFDGGTRTVRGTKVIIFGVDGLASFHPPHRRFQPLILHELFHLYHNDTIDPAIGAHPFLSQLWVEGLASYASRLLAPGNSEGDVLLDDRLAAVSAADQARLAGEALKRLTSQNQADRDLFFDYNGGAPVAPGFPSRCGYLVGYRVAARLGRDRPLRELARLERAELEPAVSAALRALAAGPAP
jgi:hypothetical protein